MMFIQRFREHPKTASRSIRPCILSMALQQNLWVEKQFSPPASLEPQSTSAFGKPMARQAKKSWC